MNEQGQEFDVFRLLISAIMGLVILVIILSIITYFEDQRRVISERRMIEGFQSAFHSPNGDVILRDEIVFKSGAVVSSGAFAKMVNMLPECIELRTVESPAFALTDSKTVTFNKDVVISLFMSCNKTFTPICETECIISFDEPIRK